MIKLLDHNITLADSRDADAHLPDHVGDHLSLDFRRRIPVDKERDDGVRDLGGLREDRANSIRLGAFVHRPSFARHGAFDAAPCELAAAYGRGNEFGGVTVSYARGMTRMHSRPVVVDREYVDELGRVVMYGRRRAGAPELGPRDAGTNVFSHQERYEPIFSVAEALIAYLAATYDVVVDDNLGHSSRFDIVKERPASAFTRVVSLQPISPTEAPLFIGFHDQPGAIRVLAGWYSEFDMWFCGCDACDEPWEDVADALEEVVLSVAERGTTERLGRLGHGRARYCWILRISAGGQVPSRSTRCEPRSLRLRSARLVNSTAAGGCRGLLEHETSEPAHLSVAHRTLSGSSAGVRGRGLEPSCRGPRRVPRDAVRRRVR